ncbi:hypothetical protein CW304_27655 [Bacillus sp. UFRGS-B20]|nr:hypothetical protein CW304_27655 [Bacillus sp. UFRGS-B20]
MLENCDVSLFTFPSYITEINSYRCITISHRPFPKVKLTTHLDIVFFFVYFHDLHYVSSQIPVILPQPALKIQ